jgi:hypothetical protein
MSAAARPGLDQDIRRSNAGYSGGTWCPPDAFTVPPDIAALLAALPDPDPVSGYIAVSVTTIPPNPAPSNGSTAGPVAVTLPVAVRSPALIPFPAFTGSGLLDYTGRSVKASLEAVRTITGLALPERPYPGPGEYTGEYTFFLGRQFWAALIRGGYQGAAYLVDLHIRTREG